MTHFIKPAYLVSLYFILTEKEFVYENELYAVCGKLNSALRNNNIEAVFLYSDNYIEEMLYEYNEYFGRFECLTANPSYIYKRVTNERLQETFTGFLSTDVLLIADAFFKEYVANMNTMTIKDMIAVMEAYHDGQEIEIMRKDSPGNGWSAMDTVPTWNWFEFLYRVKPKKHGPVYRPYKNDAEMIDDMWNRYEKNSDAVDHKVFPGIWLKSKDCNVVKMITGYTTNGIQLTDSNLSWFSAFEHYIYLDGTPFGIEE